MRPLPKTNDRCPGRTGSETQQQSKTTSAPPPPPPPQTKLIVSSKQFIANFVPPDYLIEGLLQRRFIYSFTGLTGAGKTAIGLLTNGACRQWASHCLGATVEKRQGALLCW